LDEEALQIRAEKTGLGHLDEEDHKGKPALADMSVGGGWREGGEEGREE